MTYSSMATDFVLYHEDYLMDGCCQCDTKSDLKYNCRSMTYISLSIDFALLGIFVQCAIKIEMYIGHWPIFHSPVIVPNIWKTIWWTNIILGILLPCGTNINPIKCMWISGLHYTASDFNRSFFWWMNAVLRYWFSVTKTLTSNFIYRMVTYTSWSIDFALYDSCHTWNIGSM